MSKTKRDFNPNLHYADKSDVNTKIEQAVANLRKAALECGCTIEDGRVAIRKHEKKEKQTYYASR